MSEFKNYRRKATTAILRPYVPGESLSHVAVSPEDEPKEGGIIAMNPDNADDQWYVSPEYFAKHFEPTPLPENEIFNELNYLVFPSEERTLQVVDDPIYGGAHKYILTNSIGFKDGKAEYVDSSQTIQFVQKNDDGSMIPGLQSEQLAFVLLDRVKKLNARFPSPQNEKMINGLEMFINACEERVQDRINRGVMGDLKK